MMNLKNLHNNWRKVILLSACFVFTLSILPGCKKTSSKFGTEALDINDLLASGGVDTFQLKTCSVLFDTLPTDNQIYGTVGAYNDPKLGIVNASLYTRFTIPGLITLPSGSTLASIDSVVLSLTYGGYYGKLDPQTFEVYQLTDVLDIDSTYRRTTVKATTGINIIDPSSATQTPNTTSKVVLANDTTGLTPHLRLRLDNSLGFQFVNDIISGNTAFTSGTEFLSSNYFKGLKINVTNNSPANGKGAVLYFQLGNVQTKITTYFKLNVNGEVSTREISFVVDSKCADFNHVDIDNSGHHLADVLANPLNGQTQFYSQSFNAIPKIEIPTITNLPSKTLVNNALLYLPVSYQTGDFYYPTYQFTAAYRNSDGTFVRLGYNGSLVGAVYDNSQKAYILDLRHYIQELVSLKKENTGIYLFPSLSYFNCTAERVVFNGPASSYKTKPKLVIKYTEFK